MVVCVCVCIQILKCIVFLTIVYCSFRLPDILFSFAFWPAYKALAFIFVGTLMALNGLLYTEIPFKNTLSTAFAVSGECCSLLVQGLACGWYLSRWRVSTVSVSSCLCVVARCCAPLNVRYPAASVPHRRLHSKAVLRGVEVLGVHVPVDGEGSCERQPGQPGSRDESQHQLPAGDEKQAILHAACVLHHLVWSLRRCFPFAGDLWVWVRPGGSGVAILSAAAGCVVWMQPIARCQNH